MGEIRPFTAEFAEDTSRLFFRAMRGQTREPGVSLPRYMCDLLLANPWVSDDIPSWIYLEEGKVLGALLLFPRTMLFRGQTIRVATTTTFMVDPDHRKGRTAMGLLRRCFQGPQDLTWVDGGGEALATPWAGAGGSRATAYAFNWIRLLRPFEAASGVFDRVGGAPPWLKSAAGLVSGALDWTLSKLPAPMFKAPVSAYSARKVSADELLECIEEIGWHAPLKPRYELHSFRWLMEQAAAARRHGKLRAMTVSDPAGIRCGWFVYYAQKGGASMTLQIGSRRGDCFDNTLLALFRDAWEQGSAAVKGQSMPRHLTALTNHYCIFRHPHPMTLFYTRNPDIATAVFSGEAAISRLDGTSWNRFPLETWD
jgi:hypothetical protein